MKFWTPSHNFAGAPQLEIGAGSTLEDRIRLLFGAVTLSIFDPLTIQVGAELVRGCAGGDDECEVRKIFDGLRSRFEYRGDPHSFNAFHTLRRTLELRSANCASATVALCAVLSAEEFSTGARVFEQYNEDEGVWDYDHVCGIVAIPRWGGGKRTVVPLDLGMPSSMQQPAGWQVSTARRTLDFWYFPPFWHAWYARQDWSGPPSSRGNILVGMPKVTASASR